MNNILFIILSILFTNCSDNNLKKINIEKNQIDNDYIDVSNASIINCNENLCIAEFKNKEIPISLIFFKNSEKTYLKLNNNFHGIDWNYKYSDQFGDRDKAIIDIKDILLFKKKSTYLILVPTYSEEFPTFLLIEVDNKNKYINHGIHTYSYEDFSELEHGSLKKIKYHIEENKDSPKIYGTFSNKKVFLSDYSKNTVENIIITEKEKKQILNIKENIVQTDSDVVYKKQIDLNGDKLADEIIVQKNENKKSDFEQSHFLLPIQIKLSVNNKKDIRRNSNLIFDNNNNCVSEGFSDIKIKNNYFTIEGQTCYDYQILVSYYITFKVTNNEIILHKYSEEYFDKSNHELAIPTKHFTSKDFGNIKFEAVTTELLNSLRTK